MGSVARAVEVGPFDWLPDADALVDIGVSVKDGATVGTFCVTVGVGNSRVDGATSVGDAVPTGTGSCATSAGAGWQATNTSNNSIQNP